jgi:pyruvate dehydrogenase phosphatase
MNADPGFKIHSKVEDFIARSFTPPYLTATADIRQHSADSGRERFLILASDGLTDLFSEPGGPPTFTQVDADRWAHALGGAADKVGEEKNLALSLLREGLGGDDLDKCSKYLTIEKDGRIMDDTTVLVYKF